jgi:hypothetical protein
MSNLIIEYKKTLPSILCEDIIEKFEEKNEESPVNKFVIPKNDREWKKTETILYKELLIKINEYKSHIINNNINEETNSILLLLNNSLYIKDFIIQKYTPSSDSETKEENMTFKNNRSNNRYNVLSFVYYLNEPVKGGEIVFSNQTKIRPEIGKLLLFPENIHYFHKLYLPLPNSDPQYMISGQLCYDNIIL